MPVNFCQFRTFVVYFRPVILNQKGYVNFMISTRAPVSDLFEHLQTFRFREQPQPAATQIDYLQLGDGRYPRFCNEFWTSRQRQASSLHEVSYRACFKPQLPRFFIELFTRPGDTVYDPFSGRGTSIIEAALLGREVIANDVNPLSEILTAGRLCIPEMADLAQRLREIPHQREETADIDLSMFYHPETEAELVSLRDYLQARKAAGQEDALDRWIRMVATNRLTGHSPGFFSVYTLPPNQAVSPERQRKINARRKQTPPYRDTRQLILKKSKQLISRVSAAEKALLAAAAETARFLTEDARFTKIIPDDSVQLTVTSPPFLNVVQYAADNWLRCWFNRIDAQEVGKHITMANTLEDWEAVMGAVFRELFRLTRPGGWVAFEVGEIRNGAVQLDEHIVPLGIQAGFRCAGILINQQQFTKTANIWGVRNNREGTNSNRVVMFYKA